MWKVDVAELIAEIANCSCLKPPIADSLLRSGSKEEKMLTELCRKPRVILFESWSFAETFRHSFANLFFSFAGMNSTKPLSRAFAADLAIS